MTVRVYIEQPDGSRELIHEREEPAAPIPQASAFDRSVYGEGWAEACAFQRRVDREVARRDWTLVDAMIEAFGSATWSKLWVRWFDRREWKPPAAPMRLLGVDISPDALRLQGRRTEGQWLLDVERLKARPALVPKIVPTPIPDGRSIYALSTDEWGRLDPARTFRIKLD